MSATPQTRHDPSAWPAGGPALRAHRFLVQFPVAGFSLALATDIAYWRTGNLMWTIFSSWLLLAGIVAAGVAALAYAIAMARLRHDEINWPHVAAGGAVLVLAFLNNLVHARDGWTSVVPLGLTLSIATVLAMIMTAWFGRSSSAADDHLGDHHHA